VKNNVKAPATPNTSKVNVRKKRGRRQQHSTSAPAVVARGFSREAPTFHDPERAGLERNDFHAVLQPRPACHMGE